MRALCAVFLALAALAMPVSAAVDCASPANLVCTNSALAALNAGLARREALLAQAAMHQALRNEVVSSGAEWRSALDECAIAGDATACYRNRLQQRRAVTDLLLRLFAGPRLPHDPGKLCLARESDREHCLEQAFAAADTVYAIAARALELSLASVNVQTPTAPAGGSQAATADEAFRAWRTAQCALISQSPMVDAENSGGLVACQTALTRRELSALADFLGREPHWSERVGDYAARFRACLDRGRDDDVDLRIVDVFASEEGETIRVLGSRGRYDCMAIAATVSAFGPAKGRARPGEGDAMFIAVQGQRSPEGILALSGKDAECYEGRAVIAAEARLSGWIAVSRCD